MQRSLVEVTMAFKKNLVAPIPHGAKWVIPKAYNKGRSEKNLHLLKPTYFQYN